MVSFKGYEEDGYHIHTKSPEAKEVRAEIFSKLHKEAEAQSKLVDRAEKELGWFNKFRGDSGLLPDEIRTLGEYQKVKKRYDREFSKVRLINGYIARHFKVEMRKRSIEKRGY